MENLTYQQYLHDPRIRDEIEHRARELRSRAVGQLIVAPIARLFRRGPSQVPSGRLQHVS